MYFAVVENWGCSQSSSPNAIKVELLSSMASLFPTIEAKAVAAVFGRDVLAHIKRKL